MIKNKIITVLFAIVVFSLNALAIDNTFKNSLDEIYITKISGDSYSIDFLFNKEFTEPLALQKKNATTYSIILPETKLSSENIKITKLDPKLNIKLDVKEYPYVHKNIDNGYVKIIAKVANDAKLNISTGLTKSYKHLTKEKTQNISKEKTKIKKSPISLKSKEKKKLPPLEVPTPEEGMSKEDLEIIKGFNSIKEFEKEQEEIEQKTTRAQEEKSTFNQTYIDIVMKVSLSLFLILFILRQLYKLVKNSYLKDTRIPPRKKTNQYDNSVEQNIQNQNIEIIDDDGEIEELQEPEINHVPTEQPLEAIAQEHKIINKEEKVIEKTPFSPKLISKAEIEPSKGFYLIEYENEISLVGYIKDQIFIIKRFHKNFRPKLQLRLQEQTPSYTNYIVRIDTYKAIIQVTEDNMKVVIKF